MRYVIHKYRLTDDPTELELDNQEEPLGIVMQGSTILLLTATKTETPDG